MSSTNVKQAAHELIDQLPEGVTWDEVAYQIAARASIERGLSDAEAGRRSDFHKTAEKRYARIARTGETISWPEMRDYLRSRVAGKNPRRPRARRLVR